MSTLAIDSCPDGLPIAAGVGAELLDQLVIALERYVVLPEGAAKAIALWIMHTHCHCAAQVSPLLIFSSPSKRCGKSTAMRLLSALVSNPVPASNITAAALFRYVDREQPTLLLDEADTFMRDSDDLRGIINCGHTRTEAFVIRCVGNSHEPKRFSAWCPKAIALIGNLHPTLMDRGIVVRMRRKRRDETADRLRGDRLEAFQPLADRCAAWAQAHMQVLREIDPDVPTYLGDRVADNWRTLLAIAEISDWRDPALEAVRNLTPPEDDDEDTSTMLLADLREIFDHRGSDRLSSKEITTQLNEREERPWPNFGRGNGIGPRHVAKFLKNYGIRPETLRFGATKTAKGYRSESFVDAWSRYLPDPSVPPSHPKPDADLVGSASVTEQSRVTDHDGCEPAPDKDCNGVTDDGAEPRRVREIL